MAQAGRVSRQIHGDTDRKRGSFPFVQNLQNFAAMNANAAQCPALLGRGQLSTDTVQPHRSSLYSHSA